MNWFYDFTSLIEIIKSINYINECQKIIIHVTSNLDVCMLFLPLSTIYLCKRKFSLKKTLNVISSFEDCTFIDIINKGID